MLSYLSGREQVRRPGNVGVVAIYLVFAAVVARTASFAALRPLLPQYLGLELAYLVLFSAAWWLPRRRWLLHLYFAIQSALTFVLITRYPQFDFVTVLFLILCYQAALFFTGRTRWVWGAALVLLTGVSLMAFLGPLDGLALALATMVGESVIVTYVTVNEETEMARTRSQTLVDELNESHRQLELYAAQVEELTTLQERSRLSRALHDTVSQLLFSVSLTARSAEMLLERDPARAPAEVTRLQAMTAEALRQLRSFITELRLTDHPSADKPQ